MKREVLVKCKKCEHEWGIRESFDGEFNSPISVTCRQCKNAYSDIMIREIYVKEVSIQGMDDVSIWGAVSITLGVLYLLFVVALLGKFSTNFISDYTVVIGIVIGISFIISGIGLFNRRFRSYARISFLVLSISHFLIGLVLGGSCVSDLLKAEGEFSVLVPRLFIIVTFFLVPSFFAVFYFTRSKVKEQFQKITKE
ncbi:MAG: hypothetical protein KKH94_03620 [Candidatus Omnitrophica bacterium]|nr:hypothetical protein [Candidatus Omnitrophota bacterium]